MSLGGGPDFIHMRMKIGILDIDDVAQQFRPDFAAFFYYTPAEPIDVSNAACRFDNIETPEWVPHFDFMKEVEEVLKTDESYWVDRDTGMVFGVVNWVPHIQERFDHSRFPFDRQILDVQCHINNAQVKPWALKRGDFPPELSMVNESWGTAVELNAEADSWHLANLVVDVINDPDSKSSITNIQVWIERNSSYFMWNIVFVYSLIVAAQGGLIVFPYAQERFEFSVTLALTTVAFQFVTRDLVPKTAYLTILDKYTLVGLGFIAARFIADLCMQLDATALPADGRTCPPAVDGEFTVCSIDLVVTLVLLGLWGLATLCIWMLEWFPYLIQKPWGQVNEGDPETKRVMKGLEEWEEEERQIVAEDIFDTSKLESKEAPEELNVEVEEDS